MVYIFLQATLNLICYVRIKHIISYISVHVIF